MGRGIPDLADGDERQTIIRAQLLSDLTALLFIARALVFSLLRTLKSASTEGE